MGLLSFCLGWICPEKEGGGRAGRGGRGRSRPRGRDRSSGKTTLIIYLFIYLFHVAGVAEGLFLAAFQIPLPVMGWPGGGGRVATLPGKHWVPL